MNKKSEISINQNIVVKNSRTVVQQNFLNFPLFYIIVIPILKMDDIFNSLSEHRTFFLSYKLSQ